MWEKLQGNAGWVSVPRFRFYAGDLENSVLTLLGHVVHLPVSHVRTSQFDMQEASLCHTQCHTIGNHCLRALDEEWLDSLRWICGT